MSVNVSYKGNSIAELTETGTKTLLTSGKYCEADIVVENTESGGAAVTDGIVVKARNTDGYPTEVDFYGETLHKYTFGSVYANNFGFKYLNKINAKNTIKTIKTGALYNSLVTTIDGLDVTKITTLDEGALSGATNLLLGDADFTNLSSCGRQNVFIGISGLTKLKIHIPITTNYAFCNNNPNLTELILDGAVTFNGQNTALQYSTFGRNTALINCQLGGVGNACSPTISSLFMGCTQSGLTITLYTTGSYADKAITDIRNGATKATIIIKAAEDTEYNGTAYAAGANIIRSSVAGEVTA